MNANKIIWVLIFRILFIDLHFILKSTRTKQTNKMNLKNFFVFFLISFYSMYTSRPRSRHLNLEIFHVNKLTIVTIKYINQLFRFLLCIEYICKKKSRNKLIFCFSKLKEKLLINEKRKIYNQTFCYEIINNWKFLHFS